MSPRLRSARRLRLASLIGVSLALGACPPGSGSSPAGRTTVWAPGTAPKLEGLGILKRTPRAFSDAYFRGLEAASRSVDPSGLHFYGGDQSLIDGTGKAPNGGRWCFYFYSDAVKRWLQVLLQYDDQPQPELIVKAYNEVSFGRQELDPASIKIDSDEAIAAFPGIQLVPNNNVVIEHRLGTPDPIYVFVTMAGEKLLNARTGRADPF